MPLRQQMVYVKTQFVAFHRWPEAPGYAAYLRDRHRHEFHVTAYIATEKDRQVEFCDLKERLQYTIKGLERHNDTGTWSCERFAAEIRDALIANGGYRVLMVDVSEDDENGAVLVW